jgi:type II secretory pathway component PulF
MTREPAIFAPLECRIVEAGERAGRLPAALRNLASHFEQRGNARDRIGYGLLYPVALIHFAFLLPPLKHLVTGDTRAYVFAAVLPLAVLWGAVIAALLVARTLRARDPGRRFVDTLLVSLPAVGKTVRSVAILEYTSTLGALFASGIPAPEAMETAAATTGNAVISEAGRRAAARVRAGDRMHEALASERNHFPRILIEAVHLGEKSGKLDETLARVERSIREDTDRRIRTVTAAVPIIAYVVVVIYVGYTIVSFWSGYARGLQDALK